MTQPREVDADLLRYNFAAPLVDEDAPITSEPDAVVAAR